MTYAGCPGGDSAISPLALLQCAGMMRTGVFLGESLTLGVILAILCGGVAPPRIPVSTKQAAVTMGPDWSAPGA